MEEEKVPQETINIISTEEHYQQLDKVFEKYFNTLEEQQEIKENELKKQEEQEELDFLDSQDFQTSLLTEIKVLQDYQQYNNNLIYTGIVLMGLIFCSTLIYKFIKTFI